MKRITQKMVGPAPMSAERARYVELWRQGLNNSEICRIIGIRRKLGNNWRNGWKSRDPATGKVYYYPPIDEIRVSTISERYLSEDERMKIADLRRAGSTIRSIAAELDRSPSTISRELRRNCGATGNYLPFHAHKLARNRRARDRPSKIAANPRLRREIHELLTQRWSPAQICEQLRRQYPDDPSMHLVHETIYRDLYNFRGGALPRELCRLLRTKRDRRKAPRVIARRKIRFNEALTIHNRPFAPTDRSVPGAWEGDLIMGRGNRSAIATLVERTTRYTILLPVDAARRSDSLRDLLIPAFAALPAELRSSITWDQGWEMARHLEITAALGTPIYFADPHSPWQRGTNESTNRLLRDYFPKGSDLNVHPPRYVQDVAAELNARPRKTLDSRVLVRSATSGCGGEVPG
jgi:IS30 family transposase